MADQVNRLLEAMIPELQEYRRLELFNAAELDSIVKQRTAFEYRLQRRIPIKRDYLLYIRYELNLDALRRKRKKRLPASSSSSSPASSSSVSDYACVSRVCFIFERCLRRFHTDRELWLQYVAFLQSCGSYRLLGRVLPRAHLLHPRCTALWICHAQQCVEQEGDAAAMRVVMQRGLRLCGDDDGGILWLRFFGFEIEFIAKVMERKRVLGINLKQPEDSEAGQLDLRYSAGEERAAAAAAGGEDGAALSQLDDAVLNAVLPLVILKNAIATRESRDRRFLISRKKRKRSDAASLAQAAAAALGSSSSSLSASLPFRLAFLSLIPAPSNPRFSPAAFPSRSASALLSSFHHHNAQSYRRPVSFASLLSFLFSSLEADFPTAAEAWEAIAEREGEEGGWAAWQRGLEKGGEQVLTGCLLWLMRKAEQGGKENDWVEEKLRALTQRLTAEPSQHDEQTTLTAVEALLRLSQPAQAVKLLRAAASASHSVDVWMQLLRLSPQQEQQALYAEAMQAVKQEQRHRVAVEQLQALMLDSTAGTEALLSCFHSALLSTSSHPAVLSLYLSWLSQQIVSSSSFSVQRARQLYRGNVLLKAESCLLLIQWEQQWLELEGSDVLKSVRELWERVVRERGGQLETWQDWLQQERQRGELEFANVLLSRARRQLGEERTALLLQRETTS